MRNADASHWNFFFCIPISYLSLYDRVRVTSIKKQLKIAPWPLLAVPHCPSHFSNSVLSHVKWDNNNNNTYLKGDYECTMIMHVKIWI
jgi:hypothetical protein